MRDTLFVDCCANVKDFDGEGSIHIVRGSEAIRLTENDGRTEIVIKSWQQAQAVVNAIRGISASQGWKVT